MAQILSCVFLIALILPFIFTMPATPKTNQENLLDNQNSGEVMNTANTMYYYFRPVYSYRRVQSQRRRVYAPRRRYSNGFDKDDRFPTVA
ncbi:hypothetical protein TcasGA2_TC033541 [Tribolium castaneum]|uniref:Uncharacterized protein n=1 Tax=Tribolium castaneum TaxID=7070 RepID=A0A139WFQ1_TRICA|nr:hypothetical protein TcasGA2_TC033541 [Tribolium castaneum]